MYDLDKLIAGMRQLLLFYLPMFLAGYAQTTHVYVFWGTWAALLLLLWEPYLSPPFPWVDVDHEEDPEEHDEQGTFTEHFGGLGSYVRRRILKEEQRVHDWKHALSASIPTKQHFCYRLLHVLLVAPTITVVLGVKWQHKVCKGVIGNDALVAEGDPEIDCTAATDTLHYSSYVLAALLSLHLLLTLTSAALFCVFILPVMSVSSNWAPHDMMYFICKILGSALNTIVQTLVAGSFVAFMTTKIFWLCMVITGMSYVATDLLYDLGEPPVGELWGQLGCLTGCWTRRNRNRAAGSRMRKRNAKGQRMSSTGILGGSSITAPSPAAGAKPASNAKPAGGAKPAAGLFLRNDISGYDINCNQKDYNGKVLSYCQVCGGIKQLSDACKNNPQCKSFTFECGSGYCGYLKSVAMDKAQYREDYCVGVVVP
eukprot:gene5057-5298_t